MDRIKDFLKQHKKGTVIGYLLLCLAYMVIQLVRPRSEQYMGLYSVKGIIMHTLIFLLAGAAMYSVVFIEPVKGHVVKQPQKLQEKAMRFWEKYHNVIAIAIVFLVLAYGSVYIYRTDVRVAMNTTKDSVITSVGTGKIKITKDVKKITQEFTTTEEELIGISPAFFMENPVAGRSGKIEAVVVRQGETEIARTTIDVSEIDNGFSWKIMFAQKEVQADKAEYQLVLEFPEDISEYKISMAVTNEEVQKAVVNEKEAKYGLSLKGHVELNHFVRNYFMIICGIVTLFGVLLYYLMNIKKIDLSWCTLLSVLVIGSIFGFLITPYMVPDEETHLDMAYRYADILMGTGNTDDGHCLKRADDAQKQLSSDPVLDNYRYVYENIATSVENGEIVDAEATANSGAYLFMHLPGAIGIILARILHLGYVPLLYLGRFMGLLVFALAVFWGMKKLPFGKATLFVLAMLPITLQQANSFSYDSILFAAVLLYSCYVMHMAYGEKELKASDFIILCILGIAIIYCKSGAYTPIVFAFLLIPMRKFATKAAYYLCMGSLSGVFVLGFLVKNIKVVNTGAEVTNKVMGIESAMAVPNYSIGYLLQNPVNLFDVFNNTIADKTDFYIQSMLGQHLGWIQIELANVLVLAFAMILVASAFRAKGEKQYVTGGNKWWIFILVMAATFLVLLGMLVSWTPITYVSVEGVQGRYFFPVLLLGCLLLRNSKLTFDKNVDRAIMFAAYMVTAFSIFCYIHVVL